MKDAQAILRHKPIKTTAEVYLDHIPNRASRAIDARTEAIFALRNQQQQGKISQGFAEYGWTAKKEAVCELNKEWLLR